MAVPDGRPWFVLCILGQVRHDRCINYFLPNIGFGLLADRNWRGLLTAVGLSLLGFLVPSAVMLVFLPIPCLTIVD